MKKTIFDNKKNDFLYKDLLTYLWTITQFLIVCLTYFSSGKMGEIKLYLGGARKGNIGGSKVKLQRLKSFYKITHISYNLVYLLSNSQFLSHKSLKKIKSRNIPIVLNQNGVFYPSWYRGDWKKKNYEMSIAYHEADYVFWQSRFCKNAANKFLGTRKGKGEVLYNAVDTKNMFVPKKKTNRKPFTFLLTGNLVLHLYYRLETSIIGIHDARKSGLDCRLEIAGYIDKRTLNAANKLISQLCLDEYVDFRGQYLQQEAPLIYQNADAYIITKYQDPCPNTVIEAMSCGLPILYSESGGVPELVSKKSGISLKVNNCWDDNVYVPERQVIANGMIEIFNKKYEMGLASRLRATQKFEITNWIKRHDFIFRSLMEKDN